MKKIALFFLGIASLFAVTACGSDPVQDELVTYLNEGIQPLVEQESKITALYESVTGNNYKDDATLYYTLKDEIIPQYSDYISKIESIQTTTPEVREVHETLIKAANTQNSAFMTTLTALEAQDYAKAEEANAKLAEGRKLFRDYQSNLSSLASEHDVTFKEAQE
ncbi:hypothetical protein ACE3NQ_08295 [Paenibacillus terreus]|uniref:Lipoprotein n=1 Tax=Paenibacillus terreus TaxID=1387834 RepID=A0ABV5B8N3_9BACL